MEQELGGESWFERNFRTFISAYNSLIKLVHYSPRKKQDFFKREKTPGRIQPLPPFSERDREQINYAINLFLDNFEKQYGEPLRKQLGEGKAVADKVNKLEEIVGELREKVLPFSRVFESENYEEALEITKEVLVEYVTRKGETFLDTEKAGEIAERVFKETLKSPAFEKYKRMFDNRLREHVLLDRERHERLETRVKETEENFSKALEESKAENQHSRKILTRIAIALTATSIAAYSLSSFLLLSQVKKRNSSILVQQENLKQEFLRYSGIAKEAKDAAERSERKISGLGESITKSMEGISSSYQQIASSFEELKENYKAQIEISKLNSEKLDSSFTILQESLKGLQITLKQNEFYAEQGRKEALSKLDKLIESTDSISQSISESVEQTGLREGAYNENLQRILESTEDIRNYFYQIRIRLDEIGKLSPSTQPASQPSPEQDLETLEIPKIELSPTPTSPSTPTTTNTPTEYYQPAQ